MLRILWRLGVRRGGILLAALMTLGLVASSALAQTSGAGVGDICPVGDCSGPGGTVPGGVPDPPTSVTNPPSGSQPTGGLGGAPGNASGSGTNGVPSSGSNNGTDGEDSFVNPTRDQGQPGRAGQGQPGRSGNPSPTPSARGSAGGSPGPRTIPSLKPPTSGPRAVQAAGQPLLPFEVIPSEFPSLEPSPIDSSPSPTASPTDLLSAIDNLDPDPVAEDGTSLVPLMVVLAGAALLFFYFRSRRKANRGFSGSRSYR